MSSYRVLHLNKYYYLLSKTFGKNENLAKPDHQGGEEVYCGVAGDSRV